MEKPLFRINVELDEGSVIKGAKEQVNFLRFHGTADSDYFRGVILPGGVDCQRQAENKPFRLSARYVMEGTDCAGNECSVFIENNGFEAGGEIRTVPTIVTDSEILSGMTRGPLRGELAGKGEGAVEIRIYEEKVPFSREEFCIAHGEKKIYGELYRPDKSGDCPMLIMSHGFNGSSEAMRYTAECMASRGAAVYCYDFCCGGLSSKSMGTTLQMTIPSEQEDLKIVVEQIKKLPWVNKDRIYLFGSSQGGFVTALTAPELDGIAGVFLEYPAFCIPDDWRKIKETNDEDIIDCMGVPLGRCFADTLPDYDVFEKAAQYAGPVIIFHGTGDSLVSINYSEKLSRQYKNARLIRFPGQGHGFAEHFVTAMAGVCTAAMGAGACQIADRDLRRQR